MSCDFAHDDAAYVLGALSPVERQAFEDHLERCADCARSVRELAGMPGLLGRLDPQALADHDPGPVPRTLLPALVAAVRRRRRRRVVVGSLAAAAAVAALVGSVAVLGNDHAAPLPPAAAAQTMTALGQQPMQAEVAVTEMAWGTRLDLTCSYPAGRYATTTPYEMVVGTDDGRTEQVATWHSVPGRTMRLTAATATPREAITSVEIRTADGRPVLRLGT